MRALKGIRRRLNGFLTEHCSIARETMTRGQYGEMVHDWETVAEGVPCRVITAGSRFMSAMREVGQQQAFVDVYRVVLPADTTLEAGYRITVGSRVYDVINIMDRRTDETDVQAVVMEVRP